MRAPTVIVILGFAHVLLGPAIPRGSVVSGASVPQVATVESPTRLPERRYSGDESNTPIGSVGTALLGRDSLVYVLDPENKVIHVASGSVQRRLIGRSGRGPGEMQRTSRMSFLGDSIALPDGSLARVTMFSLRGRGWRTLDVAPASAPGFGGINPVAYGRSSVIMIGSNGDGRPEPGKTNDQALFIRRHGTSKIELLTHLVRTGVGMDIPVQLRGAPANMPRAQPFVIAPMWDVAREGGGATVVDTAGRSASAVTVRVRQWNNDGQLARTCLLSRPLRPLTSAAYEAGIASVGPPAAARDVVKVDWATVRRTVVRPTALPPYRGVRLASDGTVWIRTEASFESKQEEYLVLSPTGCAAPRRIRLPLESLVEDARGPLFITSGFVDDAPAIDMWRY